VLLRDSAAARDLDHQTLVLEEVPPGNYPVEYHCLNYSNSKTFFFSGINIFALLKFAVSDNITKLDGWRVIFSSNSSAYGNISSFLEVHS